MLKLAKVYLWLLWIVPTLIFLGVPSSFSLVIFSIPIVFGVLKINMIATILPIWAVAFFMLLTALSSFFGDVPIANVLISYSLILQFAFGFALVTNLTFDQFRSLLRQLNYLCYFQTSIAIVQIFVWKRPGDSINGSMLGDPHGTNILTFLLFVTLLLNWEFKNLSAKKMALALTVCIFIGIKADAKIVLLSSAIFALLLSVTKVIAKGISLSTKLTALFSAITMTVLVMASGIPQYARIHWSSEINSALSSKSLILEEVSSSRTSYGLENSILIGAGPTQTVSRSAIIAESIYPKTQSLFTLEVRQPRYYSQFIQTTGKFNVGPISSVAQPLSSIVGLIADYGILGSLVLIFLYFIPVLKRIHRSSVGRKTIPLLLCLFLVPLSYFNTFLEFPQAVFPFVIALQGMTFSKKNVTKKIAISNHVV